MDRSRWRASWPRPAFRRGRLPGLRTAKTTLAAVVAYVLADVVTAGPEPVLAPLTALLVVQLTLYETVASGFGRIISVVAGVCVAVGVASLVGLTWWSLGLVVLVSLVIGHLLRLGDSRLEVPISAMIVLAVGGDGDLAASRVQETLIGAAVGVVVNVVIAPPLYVRPAEDALRDLVGRLGGFFGGLSEEVGQGWSRETAMRWLDRARELGRDVARADRALARAEQSARFHPHGSRARSAGPRLQAGLTALEHAYVAMRSLCRALLDRAFFVPEDEQDAAYAPEVRAALAALLAQAGTAVGCVGEQLARPTQEGAAEVDRCLAGLVDERDRLSALLSVDPLADQGAWQQHGALLAAVDRIRVELAAAVHPVTGAWHPAPVMDRPRQALRRAVPDARRRPKRRRR